MANQDGTSSADSLELQIKRQHVRMVVDLSLYFSPDLEHWEKLLQVLSVDLEPVYIRRKDNNFMKICKALMAKGIIRYGSYDYLYEVISSIDVRPAEIIKKASDEIKDIQSRGEVVLANSSKMANKDGTSSADSPEWQIKIKHSRMVVDVSQYFSPGLHHWEKLLQLLSDVLEPVYLRGKDNNFFTICKALMAKGVIRYGSYDYLYKMISSIDVRAAEIIKKASDEMKDIQSRGPSQAQRPRPEEGDQTKGASQAKRPRTEEGDQTKDLRKKEANYKRIMEKKTETQTIKLTFIGHARAGKTCLMRQLLRKHIKPGGPDRTNLADLLTKRLRYKLGTSAKEMEKIEKGKEAELCRQRLRRLRKRRADTRTNLIYQRNDLSTADSNADTDQNLNIDDGKEDSNYEDKRKILQLSESQRKAIEDINIEDDRLDDSSVAYVTMFDFGGDEIFRNYHHCLMSANSIYLLVFDVSLWENPDNQNQILGEIEYWLNAVVTYAKDEFDDREGIPPIIMIGSHMDKVTTTEKRICDVIRTKLQERQPSMADILDQHVKEILFIGDMNNSDLNAEKYLAVWCEIEKCVDLQSCWHKSIPVTWLALEEKLMLEKEKGVKFLNIKQVLDINSEMLVPLEENDLVSFLRYMHNAASIISFDIFGKTDSKPLTDQDKKQLKVILDINWIIKAFGTIITDDNFVDRRSNKQHITWNNYKTTAILTNEVISLQWSNVTYDHRKVLISQMKALGFITEREPKEPKEPEEPKEHIVPCLLREASSDCIRQILTNESVTVTKTLCLIFHYQFIPQVTWDKTVAFCMSKFGECTYPELGNEKSTNRDLICRSIDDIWNFVLHCRGVMLKLTMFNHHEQPVTNGVGNNLRIEIEDIIKTVLSMTNQGHRQFAYYLHWDVCIDDGENRVRKPKIETLTNSNYKIGKGCFLTQADCKAWFGDDVSKVPAQFTDMTKVKKIHAKMMRDLSTWICPGLDCWEDFLTEVEVYLPPKYVYGVSANSFPKVCSRLMGKKVIKYGEYDILREIVHSIHVDAAEFIDNAMLNLEALRM